MPTHFGTDPADSDSDEEYSLKKDEYGDRFEDYGFLKRAEDYKAAGNREFGKERYQRALKEYDNALDQLLTVAFDKSIILGKRKWNDIVVFRSLIHLNKSTVFFKLQEWQKSCDEALACLVGNLQEEMIYTDPHIRAKVKESERKNGTTGAVTFLEQRLPRPMRAKAWFRMSKCYANLDFLDRAKEAMAKALEMCDDQDLLAELSQHSVRIDLLERQQKERQKKQFVGFWDKLQDRGGYTEKKSHREERYDRLNYQEKINHVEKLDDSDVDEDAAVDQLAEEVESGLRSATISQPYSSMEEDAPPLPTRQDQSLRSRGVLSAADSELDANASWQQQHEEERQRRDAMEDEELERARQRLAQQRLQKATESGAKARVQRLDDSDGN